MNQLFDTVRQLQDRAQSRQGDLTADVQSLVWLCQSLIYELQTQAARVTILEDRVTLLKSREKDQA